MLAQPVGLSCLPSVQGSQASLTQRSPGSPPDAPKIPVAPSAPSQVPASVKAAPPVQRAHPDKAKHSIATEAPLTATAPAADKELPKQVPAPGTAASVQPGPGNGQGLSPPEAATTAAAASAPAGGSPSLPSGAAVHPSLATTAEASATPADPPVAPARGQSAQGSLDDGKTSLTPGASLVAESATAAQSATAQVATAKATASPADNHAARVSPAAEAPQNTVPPPLPQLADGAGPAPVRKVATAFKSKPGPPPKAASEGASEQAKAEGPELTARPMPKPPLKAPAAVERKPEWPRRFERIRPEVSPKPGPDSAKAETTRLPAAPSKASGDPGSPAQGSTPNLAVPILPAKSSPSPPPLPLSPPGEGAPLLGASPKMPPRAPPPWRTSTELLIPAASQAPLSPGLIKPTSPSRAKRRAEPSPPPDGVVPTQAFAPAPDHKRPSALRQKPLPQQAGTSLPKPPPR